MPADGVNDHTDQDRIGQVHGELRPLGHGARNDCRSCCAEHRLEHQEPCDGKLRIIEAEVEQVGHPDESSRPEHEAETYGPEEQRTHHKVEQVLHHNISRILRTGETGFHKGESRLHEKH